MVSSASGDVRRARVSEISSKHEVEVISTGTATDRWEVNVDGCICGENGPSRGGKQSIDKRRGKLSVNEGRDCVR